MNPPTITPGSNGYMAAPAATNYGTNPWQGMATSDGAAAVSGTLAGQQNLTQMQNQYTATQNLDPYPTYPNSAGVGSQTGFSSAPAAATTSPIPDVSSRGFNPWSLQGEANAR